MYSGGQAGKLEPWLQYHDALENYERLDERKRYAKAKEM
jgi:hypothetical protein